MNLYDVPDDVIVPIAKLLSWENNILPKSKMYCGILRIVINMIDLFRCHFGAAILDFVVVKGMCWLSQEHIFVSDHVVVK